MAKAKEMCRKEDAIELLAWPESLLSSSNAIRQGFVVGWRMSVSSEWPTETLLVAGIIPIQVSFKEEYSALCSIIKNLDCCYCCSCGKSSMVVGSCCAGCTRRLCFEELGVVAFFDKSGMKSPILDLPLITQTHGEYPLFGPGQLLLYDQSDALYWHGTASSFFSQKILSRLTHAGSVLDFIKQGQTVASTGEMSVLKTREYSQRMTRTDDEDRSKARGFRSFFETYSLLFRHIMRRRKQTSVVPIVRITKTFWPSKKATSGGSCRACKKPQLLAVTRYESSSRSVSLCNELFLASIDAVIGILLGATLAYIFSSRLTSPLFSTVIEYHYRLLSNGLQWLERFPIGFKLNERLTENVGREISRFWAVHEWAIHHVAAKSEYLQAICVGVSSILALLVGGSGLFALFFDILRILTLHISSLTWCTQQVYKFELYLLTALWTLFRGKKRNILRHRTDTMEYDSMQLLLGTILFTLALFLFTTIFVYYVFFTVLYFATTMVTLSFALMYLMMLSFPWGSLVLKQRRPGWLTEEVYLEEMETEKTGSSTRAGTVEVTYLRTRRQRVASIFSDLFVPQLKSMLSWPMVYLFDSVTGLRSSQPLVTCILPD